MSHQLIMGLQNNLEQNGLKRENKIAIIFKTGRFNNIGSAVIISSVSRAVQS